MEEYFLQLQDKLAAEALKLTSPSESKQAKLEALGKLGNSMADVSGWSRSALHRMKVASTGEPAPGGGGARALGRPQSLVS